MGNHDLSSHHADASRASLGFPLGTALLLILVFGFSGIFSCCYHWDKLRSLRGSYTDPDPDVDIESSFSTSKPHYMDLKKKQSQSLPVLMPGDEIPKFIALPCPCEPPRQDHNVEVKVEKPPKTPRFPVPLY